MPLRRLIPVLVLAPLTYVACHASIGIDTAESFDASAPDAARNDYKNTLGVDGETITSPPLVNPLCGAVSSCNPDNTGPCDAPQGTAGAGGAGGDVDAAAPSSGGQAGASGSGFKLPELDGGGTVTGFACQVTRQGTEPRAECVTAGTRGIGDSCAAPSDCQPGLACVSDGNVGRCLRYCCGGSGGCPDSTYCSTRPLKEDVAGDADPLEVPVCVPTDNCSLTEPYPCTGMDCTCPTGTACTVVRSDATGTWTSCEVPGTGVEGEDCSQAACAYGFICSKATNTCVKLCLVNANSNECGTGRCQSAADLPSNWGVCVGEMGDGG
jgi:hypothetical protein